MNVPPGEKLARFIRYNSHFRLNTNEVRYEAFLPRNHETSLSASCISGLLDNEIWKIGWEHVQQGGPTIKARADLLAGDVCKSGLKAIADGQGHERHVSIKPFPIVQNTVDRRKRQDIARKLAKASTLEIPPTQMS
jgi:hypothetical protein